MAIDKIYKVVRHDGSPYYHLMGTYSTQERAMVAVDWIVNHSTPFEPAKYIPTEYYEIEEYAINLRPDDRRQNAKLSSMYFDYEGDFTAEYIIEGSEWTRLCLGQIDCGVKLEVSLSSLDGMIDVRDEDDEGKTIHTSLDLSAPEKYGVCHHKQPLSIKQIKAVLNLLKSPCRNKRFRTNWEYALIYWYTKPLEGIRYAYGNLKPFSKGPKLPSADEFIKICNQNK